MEAVTEAQIQSAILQYLNLKGILAWRANSGMHMAHHNGKDYMIRLAPKGTSDIIGCLGNGKMLAIEVKRPKGVPTSDQQNFIDKINQRGGVAFVATSIDDVEKELKERY